MARRLKSDRLLFWATLFLVGVSVVMVFSASAVQFGASASGPFVKQAVWAVLGVAALLIVMRIDYHEFQRPAVIWALLVVTGVALLAVFAFAPKKNTHRWIVVGPLSLQPSELAKLTALVFTAALLERRMHRVNDLAYALLPVGLVAGGLAGLIVLEPDFGTAAVLLAVVTSVVFAAGLSYRYLVGTLMVLAPAAMALVVFEPYRFKRIVAFLDPWADPFGSGYQIVQSLIAVGSGGILGRGFMAGVQKLYYIPEPHNDYIFAVIAEELGLIGTSVALGCFAVIAWRGLRTSLVAPDRFGSLLALGLTMMVTIQAFMNVSVVIAMLPPKGIPLPFVSNGGSSLLVNLVAMGILLNISQQASPAAAAEIEGYG
jgi:cell division protein FtsW